jgi:hypothetical protein
MSDSQIPLPPSGPDAAWLSTWRRDVDDAGRRLTTGFEDRFGYPPGTNATADPDPADLAAADELDGNPAVAATLTPFHRHTGRVDLADVGNAYFIHSAAAVLRDLTDSGPIAVGAQGVGGPLVGVLFASDGGGIHFVIDSAGAIHRSDAAGRFAAFQPIAEDLKEFLDDLRRSVIRFVDTGQPGDL